MMFAFRTLVLLNIRPEPNFRAGQNVQTKSADQQMAKSRWPGG
jgi:hypothetical protein